MCRWPHFSIVYLVYNIKICVYLCMGFFLYISADRHEETHSKDVKKKKTMALVYWICHVSQNQNRPRWSTVASSIINQLLLPNISELSQAHCGAIEFEYLQINLKFNAVAGIAIRTNRILQDF